LIDLSGKLESAVAKFDKALEDVRAEIDAQRKAVDEAEAHVEEAVASFDDGGSPVVSEEVPSPAPAEPVVEEQPVVYQPPVS
jgi:hypothetical protein